ncbi:hypothetical protein [Granulicella sibirica]|uniref:hypothetical protein n=1 Tax=Granulicella sibirica TaxID=2479048 RepID=UPI001009095B|nr:hypothetical protein [Granulicella sibirica]
MIAENAPFSLNLVIDDRAVGKISNVISILHEREYKTLGDIEIRETDWQRIRERGRLRFMADCCRSSISGRVGLVLMLSSVEGLHSLHSIDTSAWLLLLFGAYALSASIIYSARAWGRLERRFDRSWR